MPEQNGHGKGRSGIVKSVIVTMAIAFLAFLGKEFWAMMEDIRSSHLGMQSRLEQLERDEAKWATLKHHDDMITELKVEFEVISRIWEWNTGRPVPRDFPIRSEEFKVTDQDLRDMYQRANMWKQQRLGGEPKKK